MQYLVDRDFIANDIYQGRALPMLTNISPLDYDQLTVFPVTSVANIRYDAEFAKQQITTAMEAAGAQLGGDGKWTLQRQPDHAQDRHPRRGRAARHRRPGPRRARRARLPGRSRSTSSSARPRSPSTPATRRPSSGTSTPKGWGRGAANRYDDAGINQFTAPWLGNMPGWQEVGFWQYENADSSTTSASSSTAASSTARRSATSSTSR